MSHSKAALVVEGEEQRLRLMTRIFERAGNSVLQARSAEGVRTHSGPGGG